MSHEKSTEVPWGAYPAQLLPQKIGHKNLREVGVGE